MRSVWITAMALLASGCVDAWSLVEIEGEISFEGVPVASGFASLTAGGPGIAYGDVANGRYTLFEQLDNPDCPAVGVAVVAENPNRFVGEARAHVGSCGEHVVDFDFYLATVRGTITRGGQPYDHAHVWVTLDGVPPNRASAQVLSGQYQTHEFVIEGRSCETFQVHAAIFDSVGFVSEQRHPAGGCSDRVVDFVF